MVDEQAVRAMVEAAEVDTAWHVVVRIRDAALENTDFDRAIMYSHVAGDLAAVLGELTPSLTDPSEADRAIRILAQIGDALDQYYTSKRSGLTLSVHTLAALVRTAFGRDYVEPKEES